VAATASSKILAAIGCNLLALAALKSVFQHYSPTVRSGLLAVVDVVGSSTWKASAATVWNASVDDTASTYFLTTHSKTSLCKFDPNVVDLLIF
jgi:hypothetical protein